jgi:hypothetical protein
VGTWHFVRGVLAIVLAAGCSSSGPLTQPEVDQRLLIEAALGTVTSSKPGVTFDSLASWISGSGTIHVLDTVDPDIVTRMREQPDFGQSLTDEGPLVGELTAETQDAIRAGLGQDRTIEFVANRDDVPRGREEILGCAAFEEDGILIAFAPVRALAVHGDVFFVAVEVSHGCDLQWLAVRLVWQPDEPFGGTWEAVEVIELVGVSV